MRLLMLDRCMSKSLNEGDFTSKESVYDRESAVSQIENTESVTESTVY